MRSERTPIDRPRNVLVVSTVDHPEEELRAYLRTADRLKVVVPVVSQGVLDWLANDETAFSHAQHVAERTAAELPGDEVETLAGEADVDLALRDALATFPADEIVLAVPPPERRGIVEAGAAEHMPAGAFDGIPVRRVVIVDAGSPGAPSTPPGEGRPPGFSTASGDGSLEWERRSGGDAPSPTTRAARTPVVALGATVIVIAVVFVLAVSLAALAYIFSG